MSHKKTAPRVLFGVGGNADKCVVGYNDNRMPKGLTVSILQLSGEVHHEPLDENIQLDKEVVGEYFHMHFCNRKSLCDFIAHLQSMEENWDTLTEDIEKTKPERKDKYTE